MMGEPTGFRPVLNPTDCLTQFEIAGDSNLRNGQPPTNLTDADSDLGSTPHPSFAVETIRLGMPPPRTGKGKIIWILSCYNQGYSYFQVFQYQMKILYF